MRSRNPTLVDLERMRRALGLVTAYNDGVETKDFDLFGEMVEEETHPQAMLHALTQFSWVLLANLDTAGFDKDKVLDWYGAQFALREEELRDE